MKSFLKILVLGAVPILAVTMVANPALAADKGSQLIFRSNMAHKNFISIVNANSGAAVTLLVQYYNNEMEMVVWYLRVLRADTNLLVDPFDHAIPGSGDADKDIADTNVGDAIMASGKAGNGHFVIAITAVGANTVDNAATTANELNNQATANILFPSYLAKDLHGMDNIDNCGAHLTDAATTALTRHPTDKKYDCLYAAGATASGVTGLTADTTSENVGALSINTAETVAFNHLTGHFTEALLSTDVGGADQTASWGRTPIVRPAVNNTNNAEMRADYTTLSGLDTTDDNGGRLAEKDAGGTEDIDTHTVADFQNRGDNLQAGTDPSDDATTNGKILNGPRSYSSPWQKSSRHSTVPASRRTALRFGHIHPVCSRIAPCPAGAGTVSVLARLSPRTDRGINDGALVLPALHGGGAETKQVMLLLSATDDFGDPARGKGGDYKLIPAMTGYMVTPIDQGGNPLDMEAGAADPVFGSGAEGEKVDVPSAAIIVNGISVMTNANLAKCTGTEIDGPWTLSHLRDLKPEVSAGGKDFAGLDAMIDPEMNASPGWVKFARMALTCKKDYGDGDAANLTAVENADGVPVSDERTYMAGTLIVSEKSTNRAFVTTRRALLKFITSQSTFAASWTLKSPVSGTPDDVTN